MIFPPISCLPSPPPSFLIIEHDREFARRVRRGAGADLTASGATKIAGSLNFKDKYAPDFPRVRIRDAQPGRMTSPAELERMWAWSRRQKPSHSSPLRGVFHEAPTNGRAMACALIARHATAPAAAPTAAARITSGA